MCKDQRGAFSCLWVLDVPLTTASQTTGFKTLIQQESETFLRSNQTLLSTTVTQIEYTSTGVVVHVVDGKGKKKSLSANHVCVQVATPRRSCLTFSIYAVWSRSRSVSSRTTMSSSSLRCPIGSRRPFKR